MGRSEDFVSRGHTHKGRHRQFCLRSAPREAEYSTRSWRLILPFTWVFYSAFLPAQSVQGHFNSQHVPAMETHFSALASCPLPSRVSFSIQRFWNHNHLSQEKPVNSAASSRIQIPFPCPLLISLIKGNLYFRLHFSFFFPILSKQFYLHFSSIQCIGQNPESILTQES